jgi:hypothetical protein
MLTQNILQDGHRFRLISSGELPQLDIANPRSLFINSVRWSCSLISPATPSVSSRQETPLPRGSDLDLDLR